MPGGTQLKKTYQGLKSYNQSGSFTSSGQLRFPVKKGIGPMAQSALFGQYASQESQDYVKRNFTRLSVKNAKIYKGMVAKGTNPVRAFNYLFDKQNIITLQNKIKRINHDKELSSAEKKRQTAPLYRQLKTLRR